MILHKSDIIQSSHNKIFSRFRFKISSSKSSHLLFRMWDVEGRWFQALYDNHWHLTDITTNIEKQHKWDKEEKEMANIKKSLICALFNAINCTLCCLCLVVYRLHPIYVFISMWINFLLLMGM